jgi:hypothetical protein
VSPEPSEDHPRYHKLRENTSTGSLFMIIVDEGWRTSILCSGMYERDADWLVSVIQGKARVNVR